MLKNALRYWLESILLLCFSVLVLGIFFKSRILNNVRSTMLLRTSNDFQLHLSLLDSDDVVLYDVHGRRETVKRSVLQAKKNPFLGFLLRELASSKDIELRADSKFHCISCAPIKSSNGFVFPISDAVAAEMKSASLLENLYGLVNSYVKNPVVLKDKDLQALKRIIYVLMGAPYPLGLLLTNKYVFLELHDQVRVFELDVAGFLARYDIKDIPDGRNIFKVLIYGRKAVVIVPTNDEEEMKNYIQAQLFFKRSYSINLDQDHEVKAIKGYAKDINDDSVAIDERKKREFDDYFQKYYHSQQFSDHMAAIYLAINKSNEKKMNV